METLWRGAGIVALQRGRAGRRGAVMQELRAYWEALRDGGSVPFRRQIDPRGIERVLEHAFLAERIAPGVARLRLAGRHLADLMGMEVRGMPLSALFVPAAREDLAAQVEQVFAGPARVELELSGERGLGRPALAASMLLLPLRSDRGEVNRALGCLVAEGPIGRTPRRFAMLAAVTVALFPDRASLLPEAGPAQPLPGLAEPAAPFQPQAAPRPAGRPALRLVKSDR